MGGERHSRKKSFPTMSIVLTEEVVLALLEQHHGCTPQAMFDALRHASKAVSKPDMSTWKIVFGTKFKGKTFEEIYKVKEHVVDGKKQSSGESYLEYLLQWDGLKDETRDRIKMFLASKAEHQSKKIKHA